MSDTEYGTTVSMYVTEEQAERIREQAEREKRPVSNLLKTIVLPEIDKRLREHGDTHTIG